MLQVDQFCATIETGGGKHRRIQNWSKSFAAGKLYTIVGPSGVGKTSLALALIGWPRRNVTVTGGDVRLDGASILSRTAGEKRQLWGNDVLFVPQSSATALKAGRAVLDQVSDFPAAAQRRQVLRAEIEVAARRMGVEGLIAGRRPHQFSGGQLQRAMLAPIFALSPRVVILDEPTTGLHVDMKAGVIGAIKERIEQLGAVGLVITHESEYFARFVDDEVDMAPLLIDEADREMPSQRNVPGRRYWFGRAIWAGPRGRADDVVAPAGIKLSSLSVRGANGVQLVTDVSLAVAPGTAMCLSGPSGSGKTTILRTIAGQHRLVSGRIAIGDEQIAPHYSRRTGRQRRLVSYVPQSVRLHLNPKLSVGYLLERRLASGRGGGGDVAGLLDLVELPRRYLFKTTAELSGGECQRLGIVLALAEQPRVLLLDEVTSSLDPVSSERIGRLLADFRDRRITSILFSTHDPRLIQQLGDTIVRLESGRVVATAEIFPPEHASTRVTLERERAGGVA